MHDVQDVLVPRTLIFGDAAECDRHYDDDDDDDNACSICFFNGKRTAIYRRVEV